jgi:Fis family transcriptional regulator
MNGHEVNDLYHVVLSEVEPAILNVVMDYVDGNQSHAAEVLGISRSTLRKKLRQYGLATS